MIKVRYRTTMEMNAGRTGMTEQEHSYTENDAMNRLIDRLSTAYKLFEDYLKPEIFQILRIFFKY